LFSEEIRVWLMDWCYFHWCFA